MLAPIVKAERTVAMKRPEMSQEEMTGANPSPKKLRSDPKWIMCEICGMGIRGEDLFEDHLQEMMHKRNVICLLTNTFKFRSVQKASDAAVQGLATSAFTPDSVIRRIDTIAAECCRSTTHSNGKVAELPDQIHTRRFGDVVASTDV